VSRWRAVPSSLQPAAALSSISAVPLA